MKRTFIKMPTRNAPAMVSRRMGIRRFTTVSYKSDAPDADEDLLKEIKGMSDNVASLIKENEKLGKEVKSANDAVEAAKKETGEVKASLENTLKEFKELKDASVQRDERDKANQEAYNKLIAERKANSESFKEKKSFSEVLTHAMTEATDDIEKFARKESKSFILELKDVGDITTANVTGGNRYGQIMRPGITENPKRRMHVRDILAMGTVGAGNSYTFMREDGNGEGNPAPVAEGDLKSQFDMDLKESTVQIETIAGLVHFTRKAMSNIPGFIAWLNRRMPERLLRVEDEQLIYGTGATPNLKGFFHADNCVDSTSTATKLVEAIIDDIAQLEDTYERDATGIVMRPKNYYDFFKNKADGSGEYDLPQGVQFVNGVLFILGVPVAPTTAMHNGDYAVGDFQMGAQLLIQESMRIEFFEQHADNVARNKVTARIEENVAFPVYGEDFFIKGAVPAA